jgi:hypothetical protein
MVTKSSLKRSQEALVRHKKSLNSVAFHLCTIQIYISFSSTSNLSSGLFPAAEIAYDSQYK